MVIIVDDKDIRHDKMNLHDFYQKHYFFEIGRKQQLTRDLTLPVGVIVILIGAIFAITQNIIEQNGEWGEVLIAVMGFSFLLLLIAIIYLIRSYVDYGYYYIPTSEEWKKRLDDLEKHYSQHKGNKQDALDYLEKEINAEYAKSVDINTLSNAKKSEYLHIAKGFLIAPVVLVMFSGLIYVVNYSLINTSIESQSIVRDSKK